MWIRSATRTDYLDYYEYILLYVDDCLCIYENPNPALLHVGKYFPIMTPSLGPPKTYLGGIVSKIQLPNGVLFWSFSSLQYHRIHHTSEHNQMLSEKSSAIE